MRIEFQPAYVLHTRPYRDTSLLVDFFTPDFGRVSAVARGIRQRKSGKRSLLNPFNRLLVSFQGKQGLKLLTAMEADGVSCFLTGQQLYSGFYLNELLVRLLPELDAHQEIFHAYQHSLQALQSGADLEPLLRIFELHLLQELGYGIDFSCDALSGKAISSDGVYLFDVQTGFYQQSIDVSQEAVGANCRGISGEIILAIGRNDFTQAQTRTAAKQLSRLMLKPLLGSRPLNSRQLFLSSRS